ncbi:hypothetical protein BH24ACI3_BH24ACI3_10310 [soil metagenome]
MEFSIMSNNGNMNPQEEKIQALMNSYLAARERGRDEAVSLHVDEDSLAAFAEGRLGERESRPVVSHLVDCSFCRHVSAQLIRLTSEFAESETETAASPIVEPARISEVLSGLLTKIFGTSDGAVFAHEEKDEEEREEKDPEEKADE